MGGYARLLDDGNAGPEINNAHHRGWPLITLDPASTIATSPVKKVAFTTRQGKPSIWIWVPWVWLLFAATRQPSRWLLWNKPVNFNAQDASGSPIDRILMSALMAIGIYVLARRSKNVSRILENNKWLVLFLVYTGLTILWSNFPGYSLVRYIRTLGVLEMVLMVLTERYPDEAIRVLLRRLYLVHICLSAFTIKYVRNIGIFYDWSGQEEDWVGLSTDKNSLGQVAMCSGIVWLWQILHWWRNRKEKGRTKAFLLNGVCLIVTLWILRGSKTVHSSTSIIGFVVCASALLGLQLMRRRAANAKRLIAGSIVAFLFVVPPAYLAFEVLGSTPVTLVVQATGRNMTFTDRNLIWKDVFNIAKKQPLLGVGVGALWVGPIGYSLYPMPNWSAKTPEWRPQEAHNGYIDTYAQVGILGFALLVIVIGCGISGALDDLQNRFEFGSLRLVLFIGVLLCNMTESSFLLGTSHLWFIFLLLAINRPKSKRAAPPKPGIVGRHPLSDYKEAVTVDVRRATRPTFTKRTCAV